MSELPDFILIQEIFEKLYLYKKTMVSGNVRTIFKWVS